jgi:hypothetical protein
MSGTIAAGVAQQAGKQVAAGYRAVKLRLGDTLKRYIERTLALPSELGPDVALQADANCRSHYVSGKNNVLTRVTTVSAADAVLAVAVFSTATPMPTEHAVMPTLPDEEGGTVDSSTTDSACPPRAASTPPSRARNC